MDFDMEENANIGISLPTEIISYIMEHLTLADRISASQTCRIWYEASKLQKLHKNETVFIHSNISHALKYLATPSKLNLSDPPFNSYVFRDVEVKCTGEMRYFWPKYGPAMKSLTFQSCEISEKALSDILILCPLLEVLNISGCSQLFMSGKVLESVVADLRMSSLVELGLMNTRYISDSILNRFITITPNLKRLYLDGCSISYNDAIFNRFYPESKRQKMDSEVISGVIPLDISSNVLTFQNILNVLTIRSANIVKLSFGHTSLNSQGLHNLCRICRSCKLQTIGLAECFQLVKGIEDIAQTFSNTLTSLDLSSCTFISADSLSNIPKLTSITYLNLCQCQQLTDETVKNFKHLKNLTSLNMSKVLKVYGPSILEGLTGLQKVQHLYLNTLPLMDSGSLLGLLQVVPPLITLELEKCDVPLMDTALDIICTRHTTIKRLNLAMCPMVSDIGLTGMAGNMEVAADIPLSHTFQDMARNSKISLGSKAEQQIVFEGTRQKAIENHITPLKQLLTQSGEVQLMGISKLQMLESLDLSNCPRVTDLGVKHAFKFKQLKFLSLQNDTQIMDKSLQNLAVFCRSLEELRLQGCCQITDQGILYLSHLHRLKSLSLEGCSLLTNSSLEALMKTKSPLKQVGIQDCQKLTLDAVNIFSNWLNHSISWSDGHNMEYAPPPPPPPAFPCNGTTHC